MTSPTTHHTDSCIVAQTPTATLRVPTALFETCGATEVTATAQRLVRTLLAEPYAETASVTVPAGEIVLEANGAFGDTALDALGHELEALVNAAIDVYWYVELGDDRPEHFTSPDGSQSVRADGGRR